VADSERFFKRLGHRMRELRVQRSFSQEDMILFGFSGKHWQQLEAGRPITVTTLLRACEALGVTMADVVSNLDKGVYEKPGLLTSSIVNRISEKRDLAKRPKRK
jgi:transcriptional regulator with XRE-family HTH domain